MYCGTSRRSECPSIYPDVYPIYSDTALRTASVVSVDLPQRGKDLTHL